MCDHSDFTKLARAGRFYVLGTTKRFQCWWLQMLAGTSVASCLILAMKIVISVYYYTIQKGLVTGTYDIIPTKKGKLDYDITSVMFYTKISVLAGNLPLPTSLETQSRLLSRYFNTASHVSGLWNHMLDLFRDNFQLQRISYVQLLIRRLILNWISPNSCGKAPCLLISLNRKNVASLGFRAAGHAPN